MWISILKSRKQNIPTLLLLYFLLLPSMTNGVESALISDIELYEAGEKIYEQACIMCHGEDFMSLGDSILNLRQSPINGQARFFSSVSNGIDYMPAFGDILVQEEILQLWVYVSKKELTSN